VEGRPLDRSEDDELIERAKRGDVRSYEQLVERYQRIAVRTAYLVTRASQDAEDAAQEAFVKAYYALSRFRDGAPFRPWLLRIVTNEASNRVRSARRRDRLALRVAERDRPSGDAAPSPEAAALERERDRLLLDAVARLPRRDQQVIGYRYFLDLSEAEMAQALGVRPGTVKSRLSRAMGRLRRLLGDLGDAPPTADPQDGTPEANDG
jgi:RNA polymerase sigma-70 factor (ECF subfamily)